MSLYSTYESRDTFKSFTLFQYHCQSYHETESRAPQWIWNRVLQKLISRRSSRSPDNAELVISRDVFVLQRTAKKCTKGYNASAEPLFSSLNLLFSDIPVSIAFVVFLNSGLKLPKFSGLSKNGPLGPMYVLAPVLSRLLFSSPFYLKGEGTPKLPR